MSSGNQRYAGKFGPDDPRSSIALPSERRAAVVPDRRPEVDLDAGDGDRHERDERGESDEEHGHGGECGCEFGPIELWSRYIDSRLRQFGAR